MGKPAPSLSYIERAFGVLNHYGNFRWSAADGFKITDHDWTQFSSFTTQAVKEKRLIRGLWNDKTWTGFVTVSRLVRTFLEHWTRVGTWSFDMIVARCLSVVLISALGCRSGDASQSSGYTGTEYVQYKHVELYLERADDDDDGGRRPGFPQFQDLRAVVTLDYCKGYKDEHGAALVRYFRPLDFGSVHVCPVALLLVHALRHGLVHGTTLAQVLDRAAARTDLHVEWKYPERPVLAAFARGPFRCELDTPARPSQVNDTIKMMGLVSGMLSRAYGHSLRLGAVRDHAHTTPGRGQQGAPLPSTDENRRFAGHTFGTMNRGVTDMYAGDVARDYYNDRAEGGGVHHRREPTFAVGGGGAAYWDMVQEPLRAGEVQAYVEEHLPGREPASLTPAEKRTMGARLRNNRVAALGAEPAGRWTASKTTGRQEQPPPPVPQKHQPPQLPPRSRVGAGMPSPAQGPARLTMSKSHAASRGDYDDDDYDDDDEDDDDYHDDDLVEAGPGARPSGGMPSRPGPRRSGRISAAAAAATTTTSSATATTSPGEEDPSSLPETDPALLDEHDLAAASLAVPDRDMEALRDVMIPGAVGPQGPEEQGAEEQGATQIDDDDMEEAARVLLGQDEEDGGTGKGAPEDRTASDSHAEWIDGYARYNIVNNQGFYREWGKFSKGQVSFEASIGHHSLRGHSRDDPTPYVFYCRRRTEGCGYSTISKIHLDRHELACRPELVERKHRAEQDDEEEEEGQGGTTAAGTTPFLKCTRPGCAFKTRGGNKALNRHVRDKHDWVPQACDDCDDGVIFQTRVQLDYHKRTVHTGGRLPSGCLFPGCPSKHQYASMNGLVDHLRRAHGLLTPESYAPFLPPPPEKKVWVSQKCLVPGCPTEISFDKKNRLVAHLRNTHNMTLAQANELVDREARTETVVPSHRPKALGPKPGGSNINTSNSNKKRRGGQQASLAAPGKENNPPAAAGGLDDVQRRPGGDGGTQGAPATSKRPRAKK